MPRLPKWLLMKEWLTCEDVLKVLENSPAELENILARDESEEFGYSYKFVCTFAPRVCQKEIREYRFEQTARQNMRAHLKEHIKALTVVPCDDETEFLTRNQMFQKSKAQKHKLFISKAEVAPKKIKNTPKPEDITSVKETVKERSKSKRSQKINQFTEIKQASVDRENIQRSPSPSSKNVSDVPEVLPVIHENIKSEIPLIDEVSTPELHDVLQDLGLEELDDETEIDDDNSSDKINCETQTDHGKKEMETIQYRLAMRLFSLPRSQWDDIENAIESLIVIENAAQDISADDKKKLLEAMTQFITSVQLQRTNRSVSLQDPLSPSEERLIDSLTPQDWKRLNNARDSESKLRLTVYARMLLRDYVWFPRKNKPRYCRHCQKLYTASTSLQSHLVSLSGIRYWTCSRCKEGNKEEVTFTRKHSLQYHILKEVGIPRYRCSQPGCSKTHNHTHHQKSHARQHTGEQYYKCAISGCKVRFSNRNTYSRHLLQNHNTELTSDNKLRPIDKTEAQMKVYAARLRARERSKCKRQQSHESAMKEQKDNKQVMQDRSLNKLVASEAKNTVSEVVPASLEKYMRPSASQLLYGIARDVRKTTSTIEGRGKPADNLLGGLNLLATVSKYMNAESCDNGEEGHDTEKCESPSFEQKDFVLQNIFSDGKQQPDNNQHSSVKTKGSSVSVLSPFPSAASSQVSQPNTITYKEYTDTASAYNSVMSSSTEDIKSMNKEPLPSSLNVVSQHPLHLSSSSLESASMPSKIQSSVSSLFGSKRALNLQVLGNKLILKAPSAVNATVTSQVNSLPMASSEAPLNTTVKKEKPLVGRIIMNVPQVPETSNSAPLFSNVKIVHPGNTNTGATTPTYMNSKASDYSHNFFEKKKDSGNVQSEMAPSNGQLELRSVSSVSGKTYIVLASSTKGNYVHNLQPYINDSGSETGSQHNTEALFPP